MQPLPHAPSLLLPSLLHAGQMHVAMVEQQVESVHQVTQLFLSKLAIACDLRNKRVDGRIPVPQNLTRDLLHFGALFDQD